METLVILVALVVALFSLALCAGVWIYCRRMNRQKNHNVMRRIHEHDRMAKELEHTRIEKETLEKVVEKLGNKGIMNE